MNNTIRKAAYFSCLAFTSFLMILVGSRGLGVAVPSALEFWALQAMHASFVIAFAMGFFRALRASRRMEAVSLGLPLAAFAVALVLSAARISFPLPLLLVFDVYLIVACVVQLTSARAHDEPDPTSAPWASTQRREIPLDEAYELLNSGGLVLVCTRSSDGRYDLAPIAWNCPLDYEPSSRVLIVVDPGHQSYRNIEESGKFALALPTWAQKALVLSTGSVSGKAEDKYRKFSIEASLAEDADALIPAGVAASLECRLLETRRLGASMVVSAEVVRASAVPDAWKYRLHHAGGDIFYRPGDRI